MFSFCHYYFDRILNLSSPQPPAGIIVPAGIIAPDGTIALDGRIIRGYNNPVSCVSFQFPLQTCRQMQEEISPGRIVSL